MFEEDDNNSHDSNEREYMYVASSWQKFRRKYTQGFCKISSWLGAEEMDTKLD